jgi:class 3 adenylate cyclase/putative methionine-R-sulfoxide reductase with GAF domain
MEESNFYGRRKTDLFKEIIVREDGSRAVLFSTLNSLSRQAKNLGMLVDSSRSIMAERSLDLLLEKILIAVTNVMEADRSTLFLLDNEKQELWSRVAQGSQEIRIRMGEGISGYVAQTGEVVNIPDAYNDTRFNPASDQKTGYRTKTILCCPVYNPQAEIIGAIQVLNKLDESEFSEGDIQLLGAFSSLAGISIANAKAYAELQNERDLLESRVIERTKDLNEARKQSDELLLNILPLQVADELKSKGYSSPRKFEMVSVLFTDLKGFTNVAEKLEPEELIEELDRCFTYFDEVIGRYNLEKIKTIGDSYMCAGGLPKANRTNPVEAVLAAIEIQRFMEQTREIKLTLGEPYWGLRLGIHTGPLVAGVAGKKKFAYDIWGDTVNTASRLESSGEVGRVNISGFTYNLVKDFFKCEYRGLVQAKNKGTIEMYFVDSIHPELSLGGKGEVPNPIFIQKLKELEKN